MSELEQQKESEGLTFDRGKLRLDLVDPTFIEGVAAVMGANSKDSNPEAKYADHNWTGGIHLSRTIACIERHINAIKKGELTDPESGRPHVFHAACRLMFLARYLRNPERYKGYNDLPWAKLDATEPSMNPRGPVGAWVARGELDK